MAVVDLTKTRCASTHVLPRDQAQEARSSVATRAPSVSATRGCFYGVFLYRNSQKAWQTMSKIATESHSPEGMLACHSLLVGIRSTTTKIISSGPPKPSGNVTAARGTGGVREAFDFQPPPLALLFGGDDVQRRNTTADSWASTELEKLF